MSIKIKRITSSIAKEISDILANETHDETFKNVTITGADVTSDLSYAKVYFTVINDTKKDIVLKELTEAAGFIRKELSERIEIRHTPKISFCYDDSIAYGNNIERIIKEINEE